jgi:hypothetical protein
MQNYWVGGDQRIPNKSYSWGYIFYGGLPGGSSVIYQNVNESATVTNGLEFAALFNTDVTGDTPSLESALVSAAGDVASWPANGGGAIQWNVPATNINKSAVSVTVQLIRSGFGTLPVKVSYTTYSRTAGLANYVPSSGIVSFASGEMSKNVSVSILNDGLIDPTEEFEIDLISASGGAWLGDIATTTVNILDSNTPPSFIGLPSIQSDGSFRAQISSSKGLLVTVQFTTNLLSWLPLKTFTNTSGTISFVDPNARSRPAGFYRAVVP